MCAGPEAGRTRGDSCRKPRDGRRLESFAESIKAGEAVGDFGSFEYIDSRAFLRMASMADFECEATSLTRSGNYYYDRDIVFVLRRR